MPSLWKLAPLALAATAVAGLAQANTQVIDFDQAIAGAGNYLTGSPSNDWLPLMTHGDGIITQDFYAYTFSTKSGAGSGANLVGALVDGSALADNCAFLSCPTGNTTTFLSALNDGQLDIGRVDNGKWRLGGFSAGFIGAAESQSAFGSIAMVLEVDGYIGNTLAYTQNFYLPGLVGGNYQFNSFTMPTNLAKIEVTEVLFYGYACTTGSAPASTCTRLLDMAQFGVDNIAAVPEPEAYALMLAGLAAVGMTARRHRIAA